MSQAKPRIRTALIGLSTSAAVSWAADAHLPYLLSPIGQSHYILVALLNSSAEAAEAARAHFNLPSSIKCFGDPEALAQDENVDLVVCNTRVDKHDETLGPSLKAGKDVYVEWPLTQSLSSALAFTGDKPIPNSIVGLQGRVSPISLALKSILSSGKIGTVLSSTIQSYANLLKRDSLPEALKYFADRKVGGHQINIPYGHMIDYVHEVLAEWDEFDVKMQIQRPTLKLVDWEDNEKGIVQSDVPDFLAVHGGLKGSNGIDRSSGNVVESATLAVTFRHGQPFKGHPGLIWSINGTKGELLITAPGPYLHSDSYNGPITIQVHDHESDEVSELGWDWQEWQKELPVRARNSAELYERYAEWVEGGKKDVRKGREWPRLEDGVVRMKELDGLYKQFDPTW